MIVLFKHYLFSAWFVCIVIWVHLICMIVVFNWCMCRVVWVELIWVVVVVSFDVIVINVLIQSALPPKLLNKIRWLVSSDIASLTYINYITMLLLTDQAKNAENSKNIFLLMIHHRIHTPTKHQPPSPVFSSVTNFCIKRKSLFTYQINRPFQIGNSFKNT